MVLCFTYTPVFTISLILASKAKVRMNERSMSDEPCILYPSSEVSKLHVNFLSLSPTSVRPSFPTLTQKKPGFKQNLF